MVGPTLIDIRDHIEALATEDGQYYLRCGRMEDRRVTSSSAFERGPVSFVKTRRRIEFRQVIS